jgi:hypothetical protein
MIPDDHRIVTAAFRSLGCRRKIDSHAVFTAGRIARMKETPGRLQR